MNQDQNNIAPNRGGYYGHNLVFIISQPRAGSTLLQRMLAGAPEIQTAAETWLMLHPAYGMRKKGVRSEFRSQWAATGVQEFLDNYADGEETYRNGVRRFAESIYGDVLARNGKQIFLDKTPRYTLIVPELKALFPDAKFILLIRNPLSVLNSELNTYVGDDWWKLGNFRTDLLDAPALLVKAKSVLGEQAIEVRYESLVTDPERELRRICKHLELDLHPDMLDYSNTPAPKGRMNDPVGIHQHSRPSVESLRKWESLGNNVQHRHFALSYLNALGDSVIDELGYDASALRQTVKAQAVVGRRGPVFPWVIALTPRERWSLRQRMTAAFCQSAQSGGVISGALAWLREFFSRAVKASDRLVRGR